MFNELSTWQAHVRWIEKHIVMIGACQVNLKRKNRDRLNKKQKNKQTNKKKKREREIDNIGAGLTW